MSAFLPVRRIVAGVAVTAALAGGGAALAAPAQALPRSCTSLVAAYQAWMDQWQWDIDNQAGQAAYDRDFDHALAALDRAQSAGCEIGSP